MLSHVSSKPINPPKTPNSPMNKNKNRTGLLISAFCFLLSALPLSAQLPGTIARTNMQIAPTLTNAATYTYAGTNQIELTRYGEVGWEFGSFGTNTIRAGTNWNVGTFNYMKPYQFTSSTTTQLQSFLVSLDGTNWLTAPIYYWPLGTGVAIDQTNAFLYGYAKGYRRD